MYTGCYVGVGYWGVTDGEFVAGFEALWSNEDVEAAHIKDLPPQKHTHRHISTPIKRRGRHNNLNG
jgi:hypothetical protein